MKITNKINNKSNKYDIFNIIVEIYFKFTHYNYNSYFIMDDIQLYKLDFYNQ